MPKYEVRFTVERRVTFEAPTIDDARLCVRQQFNGARGVKVLGIVPEGTAWPDEETEAHRPPPHGGTPPSGSPGTPTVALVDQVVEARAAA